jgi:uncharacterized protein (DUF983 family)
MVLKPGSEAPDSGEPEDYAHDHPDDSPAQWGWHAEWGGAARIAGWVVAGIVLLMTTATNYQFEYHLTLWITAALLVAILLLDRHRRRTGRCK